MKIWTSVTAIAALTFSGHSMGGNNTTDIDQDGVGHLATVDQSNPTSTNNTVSITQTGDSHQATVLQGTLTDLNSGTIEQSGLMNEAILEQIAEVSESTALIIQSGDGNLGWVVQDDFVEAGSATVIQSGSNNEGIAAQVDVGGIQGTVAVTQNGTMNFALALHEDFALNSTGIINQLGSENSAELFQGDLTESSFISVEQDGTLNEALVGQGFALFSSITTFQSGDMNYVEVTQLGLSTGLATVSQIGSSNIHVTTQTNDGQVAIASQVGGGNTGSIMQ
ncbi:hypothetical protein [Microbulbifer sp. SSSA005]|uniref:hypothetical protein n=1 Tax=Microbulbifer sp. SSSA005 TaxID=3243378 RepID=UPI00403A6A5E